MIFKLVKPFWFLAISTILVLIFQVLLAYNQSWRYHLDVDVWGFYYPRLIYFLQNHSFGSIGENEYFPGAMFFFLIPGLALIFGPNNANTYLAGLITVNILLVLILLYLYRKNNQLAPFIFLIVLLFAGPIFFFRHDLYVALVVILSLLLWKLYKTNLAVLALGIAASVKIYPALILPYFLILTVKKQNLRKAAMIFLLFAAGLCSVFGIYLILGSSINEVINTVQLNSLKPVHVESLWGSLLTLYAKVIYGTWAPGLGAHGIFGIDPNYIFLPLSFYNYFWVIPISIFYLFLYQKTDQKDELKIEIVFLVVLLFIIASKILAGQYLFWFLTLFPLFNISSNRRLLFWTSFFIILTVVLLTQYIYPLHYNELLGSFYSERGRENHGLQAVGIYTFQDQAQYFWILFLRNILLVILFALVWRLVFYKGNLHGKHLANR